MIECKMYQLNAKLLSFPNIHKLKLYVKHLKASNNACIMQIVGIQTYVTFVNLMFYNVILSNLCKCAFKQLYIKT